MSLKDRVYRTEAIVLRRRDLGEADRILSVFSPDRGKLFSSHRLGFAPRRIKRFLGPGAGFPHLLVNFLLAVSGILIKLLHILT